MSQNRFTWTDGDFEVVPPDERADYSPDEPRAQDGKWGEGGAAGPTTVPRTSEGAKEPKEPKEPKSEAEKPAARQGVEGGASFEDWSKANPNGNTQVFSAAQEYLRQAKLAPLQALSQQSLSQDEGRSIANSYDAASSDPNNKETQTAYRAFNTELAAQRTVAEKAGYKFEPWSKDGQPYANSKEMMKDVRDNKHLYYFKSTEGTTPNQLMSLEQNDTFRAVHDMFGHAMAGNQFGPKGETNAFLDHVQMFSPDARKALATETVGQNAWFNFSKANEGKPVTERKFADQKAFLLDPKLYQPLIDRSMKHDAADADEADLYFACPCHRRANGARDDAFDPGESRDENGKWSGGGGGSASAPNAHGGGAAELAQKANASGGFTYDPHSGKFPTEGYALSVHPGHEEVIRSKELTTEAVKGFIDRHGEYIKSNPGAHIGGWYDPEAGKWYLDVSHITPDRNEAETLAKSYNQEAYYDLGKHESVYVKHGKERRIDEQAKAAATRRTKNLLRPKQDVARGDRGGDEEARGSGARPAGDPAPEVRVDYSADEPRGEDGKWGEGGGGGEKSSVGRGRNWTPPAHWHDRTEKREQLNRISREAHEAASKASTPGEHAKAAELHAQASKATKAHSVALAGDAKHETANGMTIAPRYSRAEAKTFAKMSAQHRIAAQTATGKAGSGDAENAGRAAAAKHVEQTKTSEVRARNESESAKGAGDRAKAAAGKPDQQRKVVEQAHDHARQAEHHARQATAAVEQAKEAAGDGSPSHKEAAEHAENAQNFAAKARGEATSAQKVATTSKDPHAKAASAAADKATALAERLHAAAEQHPAEAGEASAEADDHAKAAREHARAAARAKKPEDAARHATKAHEHAEGVSKAHVKLKGAAEKHAHKNEASHVAKSWQALLKMILGGD